MAAETAAVGRSGGPQPDLAGGLASRLACAHRFAAARGGMLATKFALLLPLLVGIAGVTLDLGLTWSQKSRLQALTDAAATAATHELSLADPKRESTAGLIEAVVAAIFREAAGQDPAAGAISSQVHYSASEMKVEVVAEQTLHSSLGAFGLGLNSLRARSVGRVVGRPNICVLALEPAKAKALSLEKEARMTGVNCGIYSNSIHRNGIASKNSAVLKATVICSAGGKDGGKDNFTPEPLTDCPTFEDPLAKRPEPSVGACTRTNAVLDGFAGPLSPGVYCGGLTIKGASRVALEPGVYVIKDGPLLVADASEMAGEGVGFYFAGEGARFSFGSATTISLAAPTTGDLAGLLMFQSRAATDKAALNEILSNQARRLVGTIYLPEAELKIDAKEPVADESAYTAIVVKRLTLYSGPHLVLNTNYDATDVPVPDGIRGAGQPIALSE
jgi:hypothetical protein